MMIAQSFSLPAFFVLLLHPSYNVVVEAWTLADRLSGRVPLESLAFRPVRRQQKVSTASTRISKATRKTIHCGAANSGNNGDSASTKQENREIMDFISRPMESNVGDDSSPASKSLDAELQELVRVIVKAADGRKADSIVALRVAPITTLTQYLVILNGNSRPQNQAIASVIKKEVEDLFDMKPGSTGIPEGSAESGWMLLDYGSVMVHIMTPKSRLYYNVEGQWREKGGQYMDISDCLIPNAPASAESSFTVQDLREGRVAEADDPFWS